MAATTAKTSTLATQIITDAGKLAKLITSIKTRGATLQRDMHQAAVSCLAHAAAHSDVTLLQRFHDALPSSTRTNALKAWALAMGPVRWDSKAKPRMATAHSDTTRHKPC